MEHSAPDEKISIRELQRNAADVFDRARQGSSFLVTRHGEPVGRIVPPDPAEEAIAHAIAAGVLDPAVLADLPSAAEAADMTPEPSDPGTRAGSVEIESLRDEEAR
ncbi:type II toxin-antitoxin system Phd/YefM family antitoxin [Nocardia stercoris]|nr:type II toxin-antitoxin system prevent-host-death family antitoxin [Nocardia stercoris]